MIGLGLGLGFSSSVAGFDPTLIADLEAWYRSDKGITIATGVSVWADQSGNGDTNRNLLQATGSQQPTLNASDATYNHQATLSFAKAATQYMQSGVWSLSLAVPETSFIVGSFDGASTNQTMFDDPNEDRLFYNANGTYLVGLLGFAGLSTGTPDSSPHVMCGVFNTNAGTSALYVDAKTPVKTSTGIGTLAARTASLVGAAGGGAATLNGKIAEHIIYGRALTSNEISKVLAYLGTRYGIAIGS